MTQTWEDHQKLLAELDQQRVKREAHEARERQEAEDREALVLKNQQAVEALTLYISAKEGLGVDILFETIGRVLIGEKRQIKLLIPYDDNKSLALLHEMKVVEEIDYQAEGNLVTIEMTEDFPIHLFEKYQVIEV